MANKVSNPYIELFDQLPVPERLEPKNIAAMLNERMALNALPEKTSSVKAEKTKSVPAWNRITVTNNKRRTSVAYRSIASVAACAALVLGVIGYMNVGNSELPSDDRQSGGAYAADYDDVHKTFEKYYVDDGGKKTLDSAIEDIEHSYNESENNSQIGTGTPSDTGITDQPDVTEPQPSVTEPPVTDDDPAVTDKPGDPNADQPHQSEVVDDSVPLPEDPAVIDNSDVAFGDGFLVRQDGNILRIITAHGGMVEYTDNIFPLFEERTSKTLAGFYASGSNVVAVYSVMNGNAAADPVESDHSLVGDLLDSLYGPEDILESRNTVEVCVYDIRDGRAILTSNTVQGGSLINMNFANGALYLVTAYNDYRIAPIIGVEDLESYVPSYTVNGQKFYIQASDIMIPEYVATTDYTVISGITVNGEVSMKAVLGYEGRVILKNGAVYLFAYDNSAGTDLTSVRVFSLSGGNVIYAGFIDIDGVALGGAGISVFGDAIAVTSVKHTENGYGTTLGIYDGTMNIISSADFPGALTSAKRDGKKLYLKGSKAEYGVDLSNPSIPVLLNESYEKDNADGLVEFVGGYVTLTKAADGSIVLARISKNQNGDLRLDYKATVCDKKGADSKALKNNGLLFVNGDIVGLPYGYFDGYDYCYRYAIYRATATGFEMMGYIETHETDDAFDSGKAVLNSGVLYIFSEGRVYSAVIGDTLTQIGAADIIESAYSGHTAR